ncbi:hypothetical protein [Vibrio ziniensis]|uniref:Uncharacterized protein n=1 Tax=Vibrio ziniensis TaxID=2711221 RepID=A0A6G7CG80_9VIBR|nr:hypothetical protein [Vibrio ziniensis]QIH41094.1 hypothetical protein G5S32_03430 [Vibrio ziniensis]
MRKNIAKELTWINPKNERQAEWLTNYMVKQGLPVYREIDLDEHYLDYILNLKDHWQEGDDNAENRELARKAKNAWNNYAKRTDNYQVSIPRKYKKVFDRLAKKYDIPLSKLLPMLVNDELNRLEDKREKEKDYLPEVSRLNQQLEDKNNEIARLQTELYEKQLLISKFEKKQIEEDTTEQNPFSEFNEFE